MTGKINYNERQFKSVSNSPNGEVGDDTLFHYFQDGNIVHAAYSGGDIVRGNLIATVDDNGILDMRYHHVNRNGELMTGKCRSTPEILSDGRIRLYEQWQWTSGDYSEGTSIVEEI